MNYELWRSNKNDDLYLVLFDLIGSLVEAAGPLHESDAEALIEGIADPQCFDLDADDGDWIRENAEDFAWIHDIKMRSDYVNLAHVWAMEAERERYMPDVPDLSSLSLDDRDYLADIQRADYEDMQRAEDERLRDIGLADIEDIIRAEDAVRDEYEREVWRTGQNTNALIQGADVGSDDDLLF